MKPILFNEQMVQAILSGKKTQTRRIVKPQPSIRKGVGKWMKNATIQMNGGEEVVRNYMQKINPYGQPGDILWVRETFRQYCLWDNNDRFGDPIIEYRADGGHEMIPLVDGDGFTEMNERGSEKYLPWKPGIHMPFAVCRIFLEIKSISVERVQDITEEDAISEGVKCLVEPAYWDLDQPNGIYKNYYTGKSKTDCLNFNSAKKSFASLWDLINEPRGYGWDTNPFVWVVEFEKVEKPK